jgi:hypothetical protein
LGVFALFFDAEHVFYAAFCLIFAVICDDFAGYWLMARAYGE